MSDGSYVGGHCLICDEYTKSPSFGIKGLCSDCDRNFGVQNKHHLFKIIGRLQRKLRKQEKEKPIYPKYHKKNYKNNETSAFLELLNDIIEKMYTRFKQKLTEENFNGWDTYSNEFKSDLLVKINEKIENYDFDPDKHLIDCLNLIAMLWNFETKTKTKGENQ